MATCFQRYKKTTLPPLLDNYLPVHLRNQNTKNQEKIEADKKKQMRSNKQALSVEEKEETIKQVLKEQHHLETFKNLYKLRNALCERYRTLLNEKVQKQQIQIKMSNFRVQQHIKQKTNKYIPSHKVPFCKLSHDAKYLETIPQSSSYLIIGLQNELTKRGILKNQEDYENFWKLAQQGIRNSELKEMLPDVIAKRLAFKPSPLSSSAKTSLVKHHNSFSNINRLENLLLSRLSEVQKKHGEQPSRTQQVSQTFKRNRRYEQHLHYLHHMYYFSLVNMASSKRLLEKNGQFSDVRTEQSIHDLMEYLFPNRHEQSVQNRNIRITEDNVFPSSVGRKQQEVYPRGFAKNVKQFKGKENNVGAR